MLWKYGLHNKDSPYQKNMTIDQHYLMHIPMMIQKLGPLRYYSARPLERTKKYFKDRIKSPSKPARNAENCIRQKVGGSS
jgi:hypothetical protein